MNVLVTGAAGNLGTVLTRVLLDEGHRVIATWLTDREKDHLASLDHETLLPVHADVTDPDSITAALLHAGSRVGPIEGFVHLVGAWAGGSPVQEHSVEDWDQMLATNLTSAFLCCRAVLPQMIEKNRGRIVLISSRAAHHGRTGQVGYAVAKAGIETLVATISEETRANNVTANAIAPSAMDTPANRESMPDADFSAWVTLEEVARSISFILDADSGGIRGATLPIYGGV